MLGTGIRPWLTGLMLMVVAVVAGLWAAGGGTAGSDRAGGTPNALAGARTDATQQLALSTTPSSSHSAVPSPSQVPPTASVPGAPSGLTAAGGDGTALLCWTASPGADAYTLYYRDTTAGQGWNRMPYPINSTCYTAEQLTNGHAYEFRITGSNSTGESAPSPVAGATPVGPSPRPSQPTGLTATPGNGTARLCWTASPGADAYTLYYRDTTASQGWNRMPYPINSTCYTAEQLTNGHAYEFRITGSNSTGESDSSNTATATPHG
ncbi:fibronectin type III domain-containing protein [Frankia sp. QA3]|uniref:fibronectin type III domain-containing protein n=1 Tax=Frankia sp. QA3 TaxID=710111 RepID=UPI000317FC4C|nr:fibronectin type III domain-containing protein [Frankia sp. QA3]